MRRSLSESILSIAIIKELDDIKQSENNIVLFGSVGNGKTFLLNKACGAEYLTADNGYSCTRNIQFEYSLKYDMVIIDFPGLNAVQDIIGHLKVQKTALSAIPVRKIKFLFKEKFNIENVLFTTKKINGYDLCYELNKCKSKMENIKQILIKTRDLAKTVPSLYNKDMAKERELYEDKFYEALDLFKKEVQNTNEPDLKRALYFAFKDFKTILLEEYTNVIRTKKIDGKEPDMDSVIAEVLMFDNNIFNEFNEFRKQIESQIEITSSNYNGEYNRFKKCPHCGLIWFKIKGCDTVQCGKRSKVTDKIVGRYKKYIVKYINNKIIIDFENLGSDQDIIKKNVNRPIEHSTMINPKPKSNKINIEKNNMNKIQTKKNLPLTNSIPKKIKDDEYINEDEFIGLTKKEKNENEEREKNGKIKINPLGCGKQLVWKEMEDVSEEVIEKLKEIAVDDYYSGLLKINDNMKK